MQLVLACGCRDSNEGIKASLPSCVPSQHSSYTRGFKEPSALLSYTAQGSWCRLYPSPYVSRDTRSGEVTKVFQNEAGYYHSVLLLLARGQKWMASLG